MPTPDEAARLTDAPAGLLARWLRLKWPGSCEVCRLWSKEALCGACTSLFHVERPRCLRCAQTLPASSANGSETLCQDCQHRPPLFERACVAFDYAFPWDGLIQRLKFGDRTDLAKPLGHALAERIRAAATRADLVVPMPLAPARLAERGYNQAQLIARHLARQLSLHLAMDVLLRPLEADQQSALSRDQRAHNLRGVFMVNPAARPTLKGRRVALVDDVITTGSTANEATRELLRGGASAVEVWAVARTGRH
jgi:ComF family protein